MRIHLLAMVALLTASVVTGCDSAREVRNSTQHANAWGCDQCHGYPPPPFFPRSGDTAGLPVTTFPHTAVTGAMCYVCHPATVLADGHTINGTPAADGHIAHRDGQVEAVYPDGQPLPETATCATCHDAPPDTGQHLFHYGERGVACGECHKGFDPELRTADDTVHMQGLDYIVVDDGSEAGAQVAKAAVDGQWPQSECFACHQALGVGGAE